MSNDIAFVVLLGGGIVVLLFALKIAFDRAFARLTARDAADAQLSPLALLSSDEAVNSKLFLEKLVPYLRMRLPISLRRAEAIFVVLPARETEALGPSYEQLKIVFETGEKMATVADDGEFAETARRLLETLNHWASQAENVARTAGGGVGTAAVAASLSLAPLVGPALAVLAACAALAAAAQDAREKAALRRDIRTLMKMIENDAIAKFVVSYDAAHASILDPVLHRSKLEQCQLTMNIEKRAWLMNLVDRIEGAPGARGWFRRRVEDFDDHIVRGFAPLARFWLMGVMADLSIAESLHAMGQFQQTLRADLTQLEKALSKLETRMKSYDIEFETHSDVAIIRQWLRDQRLFCEYVLNALSLLPKHDRDTSPFAFSVVDRVRIVFAYYPNEIRQSWSRTINRRARVSRLFWKRTQRRVAKPLAQRVRVREIAPIAQNQNGPERIVVVSEQSSR